MYVIIRIIVHAKDEEEAMKKAEDDLKQLVEKGRYDCYRTFERNDKDGWKGDWNHLPPVVLAISPEGKHFIEVGWNYYTENFINSWEKAKLAIQHLTPQNMLEGTYPEGMSDDMKWKLHDTFVRYAFLQISGHHRAYHPSFLYFEAEPIIDKRHLDTALEAEEGLNVYVIPIDAHW